MNMAMMTARGTQSQHPVWIDCDPGHDDAMAILLALYNPRINLIGISTVAGNMPIEKTTKNALDILNVVGQLGNVPVTKGSSEPLLRQSKVCPEVHGESGLNGYAFPELPAEHAQDKQEQCFVEVMYQSIKHFAQTNGCMVNLVATGPLTNVALLLKVHPDIKDYISHLSILGGAMGMGNTNPVAEFNIEVDPEAAAIVFNAGINELVMVPLEVSHTVLVTEDVLQEFRRLKSEFGNMIVSLLTFFRDTYRSYFKMPDPPLHDPCAVAHVVDPSLFEVTKCRVDIETASPFSAGQTVCDILNIKNYAEEQKNCYVASKIDVAAFWRLMESALGSANEDSILN